MIDLLEDNEQIYKIRNKFNIQYEFYNILYYIKEKYDISVVDLGTVFNVTRQTMYNYFQLNTNDLPDTIKNQVSLIYGEISFENVIEKELLVESETIDTLPLLYNQISEEGHVYGSMEGTSNISQMSEVYGVAYYSDNDPHGYIRMKTKYNFYVMWKNYVKEIKKPNKDFKVNDRILCLIQQLEKTHSSEYLFLLLRVIQDRINKDDDEFFIYLTKYKGGKNERS